MNNADAKPLMRDASKNRSRPEHQPTHAYMLHAINTRCLLTARPSIYVFMSCSLNSVISDNRLHVIDRILRSLLSRWKLVPGKPARESTKYTLTSLRDVCLSLSLSLFRRKERTKSSVLRCENPFANFNLANVSNKSQIPRARGPLERSTLSLLIDAYAYVRRHARKPGQKQFDYPLERVMTPLENALKIRCLCPRRCCAVRDGGAVVRCIFLALIVIEFRQP
jgi:hypothetical protein